MTSKGIILLTIILWVTVTTLGLAVIYGVYQIVQALKERKALKAEVRALREKMASDATASRILRESWEDEIEAWKRKASSYQWRANNFEDAYLSRIEKLERELNIARELIRQKDASDARMEAAAR